MNNKILNLKNIDFYSMFKDVLYGLWIIVMVGCMGTMVTYTYIKDTYVPQYTSSAIYVVTPKQSTGYVYTNKRLAESVITVFQNLLSSDIMRNRMKKELHTNEFHTNISVDLITETNLMKVTATSNDPIEAFEAIGAVMDNYDELSDYLSSDAVFDTLRAPVVATHPNNILMPQRQSLKAGAVSALAAAILIAIMSLLRRTVKTESVIEEQMDSNLVGTIYHENKNRTLKAKIAQTVKALLITSPIISNRFIEAVNNIRIKMEYEHERHPSRNVFMITSVCENEGKSTVSVNVALSLAKEGKKVIILDADMRKPAMYKMMDVPKGEATDLIKLLQGECGLDEVLYRDKNTGIDLIMSTKGHSNTHEFMKSGAMRDLVRKCRKMADYVIVDTPPMSLVSDAEALLDLVDFATLVVRQDFSYQKDVENCINIMNDSRAKMLGCILNDYKVFRVSSRQYTYGYTQNSGKAVEIYGNE